MKHYKCKLDAQTWQLYTASMDCETVGAMLSESFTIMAKDTYSEATTNLGYDIDTENAILLAKSLQTQMRALLSVWRKYGAYDSEPDGMLAFEIQNCHEHYLPSIKIEVGRWGIREEGSDDYI